jgi:hypothetical protein
MQVEQDHNNTRTDQIAPVLRVSWSKKRSWHGDQVTIRVRSSYVLDGSNVNLEISAVGHVPAIATVANQPINANTLDHVYTIDWKAIVLPAGASQFEVKAVLQAPAPVVTSPASEALFVDLEAPIFSA